MPYAYDNFDRLLTIVAAISVIGMWILTFAYGEWRYHEGVKEGRKQRRRLDRAIKHGRIYRIK